MKKRVFCVLLCLAMLLCGCGNKEAKKLEENMGKLDAALAEFGSSESGRLEMEVGFRVAVEQNGRTFVESYSLTADIMASDLAVSGELVYEMDGIRMPCTVYGEVDEESEKSWFVMDGVCFTDKKAAEEEKEENAEDFEFSFSSESEDELEFVFTVPGDKIPGGVYDIVETATGSAFGENEAEELPALGDMSGSLWVSKESGSVTRIEVDATESLSPLMKSLIEKQLRDEAEKLGADPGETTVELESASIVVRISQLNAAEPVKAPDDVKKSAIDLSAMTEEQNEAVVDAFSYLYVQDMSEKNLTYLLMDDGHTRANAEFAVKNCGADWFAEAESMANRLISAGGVSENGLKNYLLDMNFTEAQAGFAMENIDCDWEQEAAEFVRLETFLYYHSYNSLWEEMIVAGFSDAQAKTAIDAAEIDWNSEAAELVKTMLDIGGYSPKLLKQELVDGGFTPEQVEYAMPDEESVDWNQQALYGAQQYLDQRIGISEAGLRNVLSKYHFFSKEQVDYAIENCGADWDEQAVIAVRLAVAEKQQSRDGMLRYLEEQGFTDVQAINGVDNCDVDWYEQALRAVRVHRQVNEDKGYILNEMCLRDGFTWDTQKALEEFGYR